MLLFVPDNLSDDNRSIRIGARERRKLVLQMSKNHALNSFSGERHRPRANQSGHEAKHQAAEAAQMVAPTAAHSTPFQLRREQESVALLMSNEFFDFWLHRRSSPACNPSLCSIDRNGSMLACMVNLEHNLAGRPGRSQTRLIHSYEA